MAGLNPEAMRIHPRVSTRSCWITRATYTAIANRGLEQRPASGGAPTCDTAVETHTHTHVGPCAFGRRMCSVNGIRYSVLVLDTCTVGIPTCSHAVRPTPSFAFPTGLSQDNPKPWPAQGRSVSEVRRRARVPPDPRSHPSIPHNLPHLLLLTYRRLLCSSDLDLPLSPWLSTPCLGNA